MQNGLVYDSARSMASPLDAWWLLNHRRKKPAP